MIDRKPIVVVGSINIDLVATAQRIPVAGETVVGRDFQVHHGGKGANQAVAIAQLGYPVQLIGRLGSDPFGEELRQDLEHAGVNITGVRQVEGSSGIALIIVSSSGENCIVVTPGANATLSPEELEDHVEQIRSAGLVLAQLEIPIPTVQRLAEICNRYCVPFILDPAPAQSLPNELLALVTWFTPNETEAGFFANGLLEKGNNSNNTTEMMHLLMRTGVANVLLKMGERGVSIATVEDTIRHHASFPVSAVDTTAAGDAFNGAFAVALMSGKSAMESARFASAAAAVSVTRRGAQSSMPTLEEVQSILRLSDR